MSIDQWPIRRLAAVPGESIALQLASDVRQLAVDRKLRCDLDKLCVLGGFRYRSVPLDTTAGGHEALLVPRVEGGFEILVDPLPAASLSFDDGRKQERLWRRRLRFRIAHEIGHSFFYDRRCRPARRLLPHSDAEEVFCDQFASALLVAQNVAERSQPTPAAIIDLADRFDVSVEAAGRAVARFNLSTSVLGLRPAREPNGDINGFEVLWSAGLPVGQNHGNRRARFLFDAHREVQLLDLGLSKPYAARLRKMGNNYYLATLQPELASCTDEAC